MKNSTIEVSETAEMLSLLKSNQFLEKAKKINIFLTVIVLVIGLIGNFLTLSVFSQRRFRVNSSNIFLLCLAINDSLFLIIHLFEDIIRTYEGVYYKNSNQVFAINITDSFLVACYLINYFRYFLRFTSAYIIVAFTLQRAYIVYFPLSDFYKSKISAWKTVFIIVLVSAILNLWVPFMFEIQKPENFRQYCDVQKNWKNTYFIITIIYISLIMLFPIIIVFIFNTLIIVKANRAQKRRQSSLMTPLSTRMKIIKEKTPNNLLVPNNSNTRVSLNDSYCLKMKSSFRKQTKQTNKLAHSLILISFLYAFLNLPYLISW